MEFVPKGFVHDGADVEVVGDIGVAELPEVTHEDGADAERGEDAKSENGQPLMQEAAEDDAGLALGLSAGQAVRILGQLQPGTDGGQRV